MEHQRPWFHYDPLLSLLVATVVRDMSLFVWTNADTSGTKGSRAVAWLFCTQFTHPCALSWGFWANCAVER